METSVNRNAVLTEQFDDSDRRNTNGMLSEPSNLSKTAFFQAPSVFVFTSFIVKLKYEIIK